jgi:hypothetical protein
MAKRRNVKKATTGQWSDCPDTLRAKVPGINLAIKDMVNPCELAKKFGVPLGQLRAFEVRDGQTGEMENDFAVARNQNAPQLKTKGTGPRIRPQ